MCTLALDSISFASTYNILSVIYFRYFGVGTIVSYRHTPKVTGLLIYKSKFSVRICSVKHNGVIR